MIDKKFCDILEYKIQEALRNSGVDEARKYWCDGVLAPPIENEYSQKYVNDNRQITLTAFIGHDGQDRYSVKLLFGKKALSKHARGLDISDCFEVQDNSSFQIDTQTKEISIRLL